MVGEWRPTLVVNRQSYYTEGYRSVHFVAMTRFRILKQIHKKKIELACPIRFYVIGISVYRLSIEP